MLTNVAITLSVYCLIDCLCEPLSWVGHVSVGSSQMDAFYVSLILFVSHAWDAVTDPLVGYLVSRSRWTPIGKFMPWLVALSNKTDIMLCHALSSIFSLWSCVSVSFRVVVSMPLAVLSYLLLWFVPQGSMSQAFSVPWYLTASCLFETLMSVRCTALSHSIATTQYFSPPTHSPHFISWCYFPVDMIRRLHRCCVYLNAVVCNLTVFKSMIMSVIMRIMYLENELHVMRHILPFFSVLPW